MASNLASFISKYHGVGNVHSSIDLFIAGIAAAHNKSCFNWRSYFAKLWSRQRRRSTSLDLALKLDMLVVLAVFMFVGAILLGAF